MINQFLSIECLAKAKAKSVAPARRLLWLPHFLLLLLLLLVVPAVKGKAAGELPPKPKGLVAGPIMGVPSPGVIRVWMMFREVSVLKVVVWRGESDQAPDSLVFDLTERPHWKGYMPFNLELDGLSSGELVRMQLVLDGQPWPDRFAVRALNTERREDFSFLLGSCNFIDYGLFRTVRQGIWTRIFDAMREQSGDFMLWLGDNCYYMHGEWESREKMMGKQARVRMEAYLGDFLESMPQAAIWDDHDFGPNNSDSRFELKDTALKVFREFWPLPPTGSTAAPGLYYSFGYQGADFFMLDNRYYRIDEGHQQMMGPDQMAWLKKALKASDAPLKFICSGSQVLSEQNRQETWFKYRDERKAFFDFIDKEKIEGVIFLTGDRHFTEFLKLDRPGAYPFYELTCSPLTAPVRFSTRWDYEKENPLRVEGTLVIEHNYGEITIEEKEGDFLCQFKVYSAVGDLKWEKTVPASSLKFSR